MIAVYLRVSTEMQNTGAQRHMIEEWITARNYQDGDLVWFEDDGISGAILERPQFQALLRNVRQGRVKKIVTFEFSRLSRDFVDSLNVMRLLTDYGVVVEIPGEGELRFGSVLEQFVLCAKSFVSATERENIAKRIKAGLANAKARGVKLGPKKGERRRLGKTKRYDPDLVSRILRLSEKLTYREIAQEVSLSTATVYRVLRKTRKTEEDVEARRALT